MKTRASTSGRETRRGATHRPVTLRDVAKACGLSVYPVSRALAGCPGTVPETVEKIKRVAAELGYRKEQNHLARRLALSKSGKKPACKVVGILFPGNFGRVNYFFTLFRGAMGEMSSLGNSLLTIPTYDLAERKPLNITFPPAVERGEVDGLLVHLAIDANHLRYLREETTFGNRPIVVMCVPEPGIPSVFCDEKEGARLALSHLLSLGHRRILHFQRPTLGFPLTVRMEGYAVACSQAGLDMDSCLIPVPIGRDHEVDPLLEHALRRHPDATALMALNDPNALLACYACQRLGLRIPDDISVVGWDDTDPFPDANGINQLTSVRFDIAGMGSAAAGMLLSLVEDPTRTPVDVIMKPLLIERGSTTVPSKSQSGRIV
jgi:DNA-binding LacI/PurR family transcriptional regulator